MQGLEVVGEGKTTKIYRDGGKAIKLYTHAPPEAVFLEARKQAFAAEAGLPVPKVYGVTETADGTALEMEYIAGQVLVRPKMDRQERNVAFEKLVALQCMIHSVDASGLPRQADRLARSVKTAAGLDEAAKTAVLARLHALDRGKTSLCHGDFHTSNVLKAGDAYWIIDWVDATNGDPLADACRSYLLFRWYVSRMASVYLRLFCASAGAAKDEVLAWLPVIAAARLAENVDPKEQAFLREIIRPLI